MRYIYILILSICFLSCNFLLSQEKNEFDIYIKLKKDASLSSLKSKLFEDFEIQLDESILPYRLSLTKKINYENLNVYDSKTLNILSKEEPLLRTYRISFKNGTSQNEALKKLKSYFELEYFEKLRVPKLLSMSDYNDPYIAQQNVLQYIKAFEAFEIGEGDSSIVIGISDSGLDQTHEDISPNLFRFWGEIPNNDIDDDMNGYVDDFQGVSLENQHNQNGGGGNTNTNVNHGLNVAGIAGAKANNNLGIIGTGNKCRIFPIKISQGTGANIIFGYESIIYAAVNNFDVINCSWGAIGRPSPIEQSIVDFAVAKGVVIVASAGNTESSEMVEERVLDWFPACYNGVISVASSYDDENLFVRSSINPSVDVLVKGEGNYTTTSSNNYTSSGISGTSFASPVISGAVGVIKYKFPELNPYQIEELVRYSGRDVSEASSEWAKIMPKYFDFQKAMQFDENTILSIKSISHKFYISPSDTIFAFRKGDEINLDLNVLSYFRNLSNVKFTLSLALEFTPGDLTILNNVVSIPSIIKNEETKVSGFKFKINENSFQRAIFRIDYEVSGKREFFLIPFDNMPDVTNFENDIMLISLVNDGKIGYNNSNQDHGFGFINKNSLNLSFYSGFIGFGDNKSFSSTSGEGINNSDVSIVNDFSENNNEAEFKVNNLGINFKNKVFLSNDSNYKWAKFDVSIIANTDYSKFGFGIVGDYDLGIKGNSYSKNSTEYFTDAIFTEGALKAETQIAENEDEKLYFGITAISKENDVTIQSAGLSSDESFFITPQSIIKSLSSGNSVQYTPTADIGFVSGVNFSEGIKAGQTKECAFCLALAESKEMLLKYLRNCVLGSVTSVENEIITQQKAIFVNNQFVLNIDDNQDYRVSISDYQGRTIYSNPKIQINELERLNFYLENGLYFLSLYNSSNNYNFKIFTIN